MEILRVGGAGSDIIDTEKCRDGDARWLEGRHILWASGNSSLEHRLKVTTNGVSLKVNSSEKTEEGAEQPKCQNPKPTEPSLLSSWPQHCRCSLHFWLHSILHGFLLLYLSV